MKETACLNCNGTGTQYIQETHYDAFGRGYTVEMRMNCPQCGGNGKVYVQGEEE